MDIGVFHDVTWPGAKLTVARRKDRRGSGMSATRSGHRCLIRSATGNMLKLFGVSEDCVQDIELALSEACTNVISHAITDDEYDVQVRVDDQQCVTSVHNAGNGFDDEKLIGTMCDPHSATRRGVAIVHAVMDRVEVRLNPPVVGQDLVPDRSATAPDPALLRPPVPFSGPAASRPGRAAATSRLYRRATSS